MSSEAEAGRDVWGIAFALVCGLVLSAVATRSGWPEFGLAAIGVVGLLVELSRRLPRHAVRRLLSAATAFVLALTGQAIAARVQHGRPVALPGSSPKSEPSVSLSPTPTPAPTPSPLPPKATPTARLTSASPTPTRGATTTPPSVVSGFESAVIDASMPFPTSLGHGVQAGFWISSRNGLVIDRGGVRGSHMQAPLYQGGCEGVVPNAGIWRVQHLKPGRYRVEVYIAAAARAQARVRYTENDGSVIAVVDQRDPGWHSLGIRKAWDPFNNGNYLVDTSLSSWESADLRTGPCVKTTTYVQFDAIRITRLR